MSKIDTQRNNLHFAAAMINIIPMDDNGYLYDE